MQASYYSKLKGNVVGLNVGEPGQILRRGGLTRGGTALVLSARGEELNLVGRHVERHAGCAVRTLIGAGLQLADPVVGQQLTVAGDDDVAAQGQHDALCALLQALEEAGLTKKAASVAVPSSYELSFWYGDQYEVKLGNSENLPYKLAYLEKVLESLADYQTGTIDLSFSEGSEARFTPKQ